MASRHRRDHHNLNLQTGKASSNGKAARSQSDGAALDVRQLAEAEPDSEAQGKIEVSPRAIAHLASRAAQSCYGVVGLASRHSRPGWAELLRRDEEHLGVEVTFADGGVVIDLYVVIEYGTRISEVARNIMSSVKFAVESALGASGVRVNVTVQGIRVSS